MKIKRGRPKIYSDGLSKQRRWQLRHKEKYTEIKKAYYLKKSLPLKIKKAIKLLKKNNYIILKQRGGERI